MDEPQITDEARVAFEQKRNELVRLIEALAILTVSKEWAVLKELVFDKSISAIERQLLNESLAVKVDEHKLYKLQGEWAWCKQYSDTERFIRTLKQQLQEINKRIK